MTIAKVLDIIFTTGGLAYRANVTTSPIPNPWPHITEDYWTTLGSGKDTAYIRYRNYILTNSNQTRNDIFRILIPGRDIHAVLKVTNSHAGIISNTGPSGNFADWEGVISFLVTPLVKPGQYSFNINVQIDGKDYGMIPCTIQVQ
jgi:hypothetical protein